MFDDIRCKYPLPVEGANALEYQTKDTPAQYLDQYEISEDGTLRHELYDIEDRSDPNAEGFAKLLGCMTRVNKRWEDQPDFTGEIRFYASAPTIRLEFSTYFVRGKLKALEVIETGTDVDLVKDE